MRGGKEGEEMEMTTDWIDRQIGRRYEGELDDEYGILIKSSHFFPIPYPICMLLSFLSGFNIHT